MRIELKSFLYRLLSLNLETEGWVDRLLFSLDGEEQEQGLSLEQKFELVLTLVERGGRASIQGSEEASTGLIDDTTCDIGGDKVGGEVEVRHPPPAPLEPTSPALPSRRMGTIGLGDNQGISPTMRGRPGADLGGSLALKRDILACLRGEEGGQPATSTCPALLSQLQTEALDGNEEVGEEGEKEDLEERRFALLSLAVKEDRMSLLERVSSIRDSPLEKAFAPRWGQAGFGGMDLRPPWNRSLLR